VLLHYIAVILKGTNHTAAGVWLSNSPSVGIVLISLTLGTKQHRFPLSRAMTLKNEHKIFFSIWNSKSSVNELLHLQSKIWLHFYTKNLKYPMVCIKLQTIWKLQVKYFSHSEAGVWLPNSPSVGIMLISLT
jgi:hypothetical protein